MSGGQGSRDEQTGGTVDVFGFIGIKLAAGQYFTGHGGLRVVIAEHGDFDLTGIHAAFHQYTPVIGGGFHQGFAQVGAAGCIW